MAKYKVVSGTNAVLQQLRDIGNRLSQDAIDTAIKQAGENAVLEAKQKIATSFNSYVTQQFTSPQEAQEQIAYSYDNYDKKFTIYAPKDEQYKYAMYYLEHGAGLYGSDNVWFYPLKDGKSDTHREFTGDKDTGSSGMGIAMQIYRKQIKLYSPAKVYSESAGKWFGITNYSKPVHYMETARKYLIKNVPYKLRKEIKLVLTRKYYHNKKKD